MARVDQGLNAYVPSSPKEACTAMLSINWQVIIVLNYPVVAMLPIFHFFSLLSPPDLLYTIPQQQHVKCLSPLACHGMHRPLKRGTRRGDKGVRVRSSPIPGLVQIVTPT